MVRARDDNNFFVVLIVGAWAYEHFINSVSELMPLLPAHLEYLIGLEKRGLLFASGPLTDVGAGPLGGGGLTVLRVANASEAREIAEAEPFAENGLRTFEIKEWTIMEGTLGLRVNLSDQSVEVL